MGRKTGLRQTEDISEKPYVKYGTEAEKYLRSLFQLDFPEYEVNYDQYGRIANLKVSLSVCYIRWGVNRKTNRQKGNIRNQNDRDYK